MSLVKRLSGTIAEARHLEDMAAQIAKQQADIDFLAAMADVDMSEDVDEMVSESEVAE